MLGYFCLCDFLIIDLWAFGIKVTTLFEAPLGDFSLSKLFHALVSGLPFISCTWDHSSFVYLLLCTCGDACIP